MEDAAQIRNAISSGEYRRALLFWERYAGQLEAAIRQGAATEAQLAAVKELVEWSCKTVMCARAHAMHRLNAIRTAGNVAAAYIGSPGT